MRYIEPHGHMVSRTTDDYTYMATAGCQAVCEPAFWAGLDRSSPQGFYDYFCQLTEHEPKRAAKFGLAHFTWLCINPKESEDVKLAEEVVAIIPKFLDRPNVLGIGEIGLNKNSRNELKVLELHIDLAARHIEFHNHAYRRAAALSGDSTQCGIGDLAINKVLPILRSFHSSLHGLAQYPRSLAKSSRRGRFFIASSPTAVASNRSASAIGKGFVRT